MKHRKLIWLSIGFLAFSTGCGRNYTGTYRGTESIPNAGIPGTTGTITSSVTTAPITGQVTITLNHAAGMITGTYSSVVNGASLSYTITAQDSNTPDAITNFRMQLTTAPSTIGTTGSTGTMTGLTGTTPPLNCATWTATSLSTANNQLSGTITAIADNGIPGSTGTVTSTTGCTGGSRILQATRAAQ